MPAQEPNRTMAQQLEEAHKKLHEMHLMLMQAEKLKSIGQLASGVAHELKNPLGIILQNVDYLENKLAQKDEDVSESLAMLKESVRRADSIIQPLLGFSRASAVALEPEDLNALLETCLLLTKGQLKSKNIEVVREMAGNLPKVAVDKNKIEQVFINLLQNAVQAMQEHGKIFVRSYAKTLDAPGNGVGKRSEDFFSVGEKAVVVEIEDTGSGIKEENLKKIFEPFFTTKATGQGTGLGLSITKDIIAMHRGIIEVASQIGKGTKFTIILKIA